MTADQSNSTPQAGKPRTTIATSAIWLGRVLTGLVVVFMLFDGAIKLPPMNVVGATLTELGWPSTIGMSRGLGILALACTALYAWPRTSVLGAILLTGYFGGAIATQLRIGNPTFSHLLFGVYLGLMVWGGLYLRNPRLRAIFPIANI